MNMKTRKLATRIIAIATLVLLLMTTLAGCGSNKPTKILTVNDEALQFDTAEELAKHGLKPTELSQIAKMLAAVCSLEFDTQEMLVAASRGYDMTVEGFDDSKVDPSVNKGMNLTAAKNVITKANEKADDDTKVTFDYAKLNAEDVNSIIDAFRVKISTENNSDFLSVILSAIGTGLRWMTNTLGFGNYLLGICLFAIVIEILMLPFAIKQQKNSIRQASLRPKEMAIRNKYKGRNDQVTMQKMQQEIQEFYQRENFSPYSGCLPLLIQLPIIMALYYIVIDPLHYVLGQSSAISSALSTFYSAARAAGGLGGSLGSHNGTIALLAEIKTNGVELLEGLKDFAFFTNGSDVFDSVNSIASSIPNFNVGSVNMGLNPSLDRFDILLLVPVLTFATYFLTSKLNRKLNYQPASDGADSRQVACSNNIMDITMPLMSTFFTFMVPALVGVYWMFRSLVGMLKQFIISRIMPLPTFTEEDYKQAEKEMKGKRVVKKSENVGKVRSLHHIDDEDFDDTRERALARKAAIEERERQEQEEKAKKTPFGAAPMKEENNRSKKNQKSDEANAAEDSETENESKDN